jgi:3-phenylpropionate/trans-cinnamate dioxygenase ferredoxin reductase component
MRTFRYLVLGGGMTAAAAAQGIREVDGLGTIGLISAEGVNPYNRPPLSKKLWHGKPESIIWRELPAGVEVMTNRRIVAIDPQKKHLRDASGEEIGYERLLLATGGSPRRLPFGGEEILYYRTLADYHTVRGWMGQGKRVGVIGGGFIGSEIAAGLCMNSEKVVMAFPDATIGARVYPADLAEFVTGYYREKGIDVRSGLAIRGVVRRGERLAMQADGGQEIEVDHIIAGIGIRPDTGLAQQIGIQLDEATGGIHVDEYLRTNLPDIYAAGDVASFFNPALGRRMRVEHADNANAMGRTAGLNLAGKATRYDYLPFFYSDLFDLGYEAVGELDPRLETYADWQDPFRQGVVYYLNQGQVRGVLLWNTWDQVDAARKLISDGHQYKKDELKGRLPEK